MCPRARLHPGRLRPARERRPGLALNLFGSGYAGLRFPAIRLAPVDYAPRPLNASRNCKMMKRLGVGLIEGLIVGGLVAALVIKGLGIANFAGFFAYLLAAATGFVTGLVAGKPIWGRDAKVEATLKAVVGAALAAVLLWLIRRFAHIELDLIAFGAGRGAVGELPAISLPLIASALALLFEIDNTGAPPAERRLGEPQASERKRVIADAELDVLDEPADSARTREARRKG
jgi:hypothetical protein